MSAFIASLLFVVLAEMGDKTQLLAMAFATRFPAGTVLAAVFAATLLNHALAVAAGQLLSTVIPLDVIALVAALSFILFGRWTLRGDTLDGEDAQGGYGPFLTVAIAFFLAEIGDKTQLATISLAIKYSTPLPVLFGTTTGMVIADGFGILVGTVLGKRLPDNAIRLGSAAVFLAFGLAGTGSVIWSHVPAGIGLLLLFTLGVATLGIAHSLGLQHRRAAPARVSRPRNPIAARFAQSLFVLLLLVGWAASLGLADPLAAIDHWIAVTLLVGLGWKLIHGSVRPSVTTVRLDARVVGAIITCAALTSAHAFLIGLSMTLAIVPVGVLLAAVTVLIGGSYLQRADLSARVQYIGENRVAVACGLVLIGMALKTLIAHLT